MHLGSHFIQQNNQSEQITGISTSRIRQIFRGEMEQLINMPIGGNLPLFWTVKCEPFLSGDAPYNQWHLKVKSRSKEENDDILHAKSILISQIATIAAARWCMLIWPFFLAQLNRHAE